MVVDSKGEPEAWWFNLKTGTAEYGRLAHALDRIGPFDSKEQALKAPAIIAERSKQWRDEDESD